MTLTDTTRRKIVILGGGVAGMAVFTQLHRLLRHPDVTLIEPSTTCDYPPLWPLVEVGAACACESQRNLADYLPEGSSWVRDHAKKIDTKAHVVVTERGREIPYEYLVVCPGLTHNPKDIKKFDEWLASGHLHTTSDLASAEHNYEALQKVEDGTVLIVSHAMGWRDSHSQPFLHTVDDFFRQWKVRDKVKLMFVTAQDQLFPEPSVHTALANLAAQKNVDVKLRHRLIAIHPDSHEAELAPLDEKGKPAKETFRVPYRFLHVTPELLPPAVVFDSKLIARREDFKGWLSVDPHTLQSTKEPNIFGLGEAANLPIPMSIQAIQTQAAVLAHNLVGTLQGRGSYFFHRYDGTTVLSIPVGRGQVMQTTLQYQVTTDDKGQSEVTGATVTRPPRQGALGWWLARHIAPRLYWRRQLRRIRS